MKHAAPLGEAALRRLPKALETTTVRLPPALQAELEEALEVADHEEGISGELLFRSLRKVRVNLMLILRDQSRTVAGLLAIAKKRAALLRDVPPEQVAARFTQLTEEIRQVAIANGTAIDGDWPGD